METFTKSMISREWRSSPTTCLWRDKRRREEKRRSFGNVRLSLRFLNFFLQIQQKEWSNSFRRGQQYTRLSVVRPAEQGQHQGCPACPLCKSMEARHGQVLLGSLCLFLDFLMARKVERTILLSVLATITGL